MSVCGNLRGIYGWFINGFSLRNEDLWLHFRIKQQTVLTDSGFPCYTQVHVALMFPIM